MTAEELIESDLTLAEALGLTEELEEAMARIAEAELEAGRPQAARTILEGLAVGRPRDPEAWVLLAKTHRALEQPLAARFCAEVAALLAPDWPAARLARAEGLLAFPEERGVGRALLTALAEEPVAESGRARQLLEALGA